MGRIKLSIKRVTEVVKRKLLTVFNYEFSTIDPKFEDSNLATTGTKGKITRGMIWLFET